ncbi:squalene/phytoene synthase family protein [Lentzea tibetensis]|uniref:squalene/phytoene synthase family protein n=1 Tax=Lentzea tibetensis TaxID=2591470 RepID=UPI0016447BAB|nr:squalene/phytoene synthase family protein [Lentzea tibetensis]
MAVLHPDPAAFCREMLPLTSRTFALTVPLLPSPLDEIVTTAYLLCRVVDTVEDESGSPVSDRVQLLTELAALAALPPDWRERSAAAAERARGLLGSGTPADEVRLVAGLPVVLENFTRLPRAARGLVQECLQDMAIGMADTLSRRQSALEDVDEVLAYCDVVASTVGRMLTGLFAWRSGGAAAVLPALTARADSFGRVLQLTNIIKDVRADLDANRCWLPRTVLADCGVDSPERLRDPENATRARAVLRRMIAIAHRELVDAVAYVDALPSADAADAAIRRFCTAPLLMAVLTLRKIWRGDEVFGVRPVKISRRTVAAAMLTTRVTAARPTALTTMLTALRRSLPGPLPHDAPAPPPARTRRSLGEGIEAAAARLVAAQSPTGSWHEDYGSMPMFLAQYVITCHVVGAMPDEHTRARMVHHFRVRQNPDGGWGIDIESDSMVLASTLGYTALRLLGVPADDPCARGARAFILRHGGALAAPHWAKLMLAVLGVFDWKGLYPFPPEGWLLPRGLPVHLGRLWCYPRVVFTSMSWLYARRAVVRSDDPVLRELRDELYAVPYDRIDWRKSRGTIAATDSLRPRSWLLKAAFAALSIYEARPSPKLRERAMATALDHVDHENRTSNYVGHGPIPKFLDTLVWHFADPGGDAVLAHAKRLPDYLWDSADGTRVQSFNSSETWDTSFAVQALVASGSPGAREALRSASGFLERNQRLTDVPDAERHFRQPGRGGWTLSTAEQAWSITDGTAEALKAVLALDELGLADDVTPERRLAAVEFLLATQNADGGWPAYEPNATPAWLEKLNFSDVFDNLMVDYSTVEPTASCVTALRRHLARHPDGPRAAIERAVSRGEQFIVDSQRAEGSWEGFWGVCFTYGTWFGVKGLKGSRHPGARGAVDRACEFLLAHQRPDGGWGETIEGNRNQRYVHAATSQAVMTSWALLALTDAGRATSPSARRATDFLLRAQLPDGGWQDDHLSGAMMRCAAMNYDGYQRAFPLWALSAVADSEGASS